MRVVSVNSPRRKNSFGESIFTRPPDVIHDFVATILNDRFSDPRSDLIEHFIPAYPFPFSFTAFSGPLQRIKYAIGIRDLIQRRRPLSTIAPSAPRILRIALELLNLIRVFVNVGEQPTRRLTVKAR